MGNKGFGYLKFIGGNKGFGSLRFIGGNKRFGSLQVIGGNKGFGSLQFIGGNKRFGSLQFIGGNKGFGSLMVTNNLGLSHSFMVNKEESPNLFFPLAEEILIYVALIIMADRFSFLSLSLSLFGPIKVDHHIAPA
jgi:hypothetical protein